MIDDGTFQRLRENDIIASQRGEGVRVSFHFYNNVNDLDKLMEVIKG